MFVKQGVIPASTFKEEGTRQKMENTEILSMGERGDNFEIIEEFLEEENHVFEVGKEFKEVVGKSSI